MFENRLASIEPSLLQADLFHDDATMFGRKGMARLGMPCPFFQNRFGAASKYKDVDDGPSAAASSAYYSDEALEISLINGLRGASNLNELCGRVVCYARETERYDIELDKEA